jgi:histidine ammonia-lyase
MPGIALDGRHLDLEAIASVASGAQVALAAGGRERIEAAHQVVRRIVAEGRQVYGVNTGFGHLKDIRIPPGRVAELQLNLVRSHAAGVGEPLDEAAVRVLMLLRAHVLARGHSGVRPEVVETLLAHLNAGVLPVIPRQGSVGASGDLAPLSHLALMLVGEGEATLDGARLPSAEAQRRRGLRPIVLEAKEGLALVNGTQLITAIGVLALLEAKSLATAADVIGATTLEALEGSHRAFDARIQALRPHPGQAASAANLRAVLAGSAVAPAHAGCGRVQDAYSLRCMPQVHGASRDVLRFVESVLRIEIDAVTDNPIVYPDDGELLSGGNFHGQPGAIALDALALAAAELASISERRTERLMNPAHSGLPPFLTPDPGVHSGLMMAQVTAAALVSENKVLCHPASVDSIPTEAGQEDHVSMGPIAARKARRVVRHARQVLAIEMLCACQALDLRRGPSPGRGVLAAWESVRKTVPPMQADRILAPDIAAVEALLLDGSLVAAAAAAAGGLA